MNAYIVTLRFQYPAHDERAGIPYEVQARSKADAIRDARRQAERDGHVPCSTKGRATFTATEDAAGALALGPL
jgi:hypothetical protein